GTRRALTRDLRWDRSDVGGFKEQSELAIAPAVANRVKILPHVTQAHDDPSMLGSLACRDAHRHAPRDLAPFNDAAEHGAAWHFEHLHRASREPATLAFELSPGCLIGLARLGRTVADELLEV